MTPAAPPLGTRFRFAHGRTAWRVWELVGRLSEDAARKAKQHGCDRNQLRLVEEEGYPVEQMYGVGSYLYVEDAWFSTHRSEAAA